MSTPLRVGPQQPVDAPKIVIPTSGLTSLANDLSDDSHWAVGYAYRPEIPNGPAVARSFAGTLGTDMGSPDDAGLVSTIPVALTVRDQISAFSYQTQDFDARARRVMEAYTSKLLERELWTGEIAVVDNLPNRRLAHAGAVTVTSPASNSPQKTVAALMRAYGDSGMAGVAMIHMPLDIAIMLPGEWTPETTREKYGFVIVAGRGYPGTGPAGTGPGWVYATEMVNVRLGEIEVIPNTLAEAFDKGANTVTYYTERFGAADFAGPVLACNTGT